MGAGCAYPLKMTKEPPVLRAWERAVDWDAVGQETVKVLSAYLQVDTFNPPGNETVGANFLADLLRKEGIESQIYEFTPGRGSLVARLPGSGKQGPLCLLSHIDVATAKADEWPAGKGPLSGAVDKDGMIWGRGALDMKGMGALEVMTLILLKRLSVPLTRDVVLVAVADEEVDNKGMLHMVKEQWDKLGCTHVINEGGLGIKDAIFPGHTVVAISVAEKGVLWLRLTMHGKGGHGSTPRPEMAPPRLMRALARLDRRKPKPKMHPSLLELFARIGEQRGGGTGFLLQRPHLLQRLLSNVLMQKPGTRAALINTINLTGLDTGGNQPNVVPSSASATLDCRLLPGASPQEVIAEVRQLTGNDPDLEIKVLHYAPAAESPWDDPLFHALSRHSVEGLNNAASGPVLSIGFTDSIYARQKGARAYGLVPFVVSQEELETMHAKGERVSVANVHRGLKVLFKTVVEVSADLSRPVPGRK